MLGLTATPERMDNVDVFEMFDANVPFELRLKDAIINDLVVPFHYYGIKDKLVDYSFEDKTKIAKEIAKEENIEFIVKEIEKHRPNDKLKCIAFCTRIAHAKTMADEFNLYGYNAISLVGENDLGERIKSFNNLQDDKNPLEFICAVDMYNSSLLREVSNSWDEEYEKLLLAEKMLNCTNFDIIHNNLDDVTSKKPVFIEIRNHVNVKRFFEIAL